MVSQVPVGLLTSRDLARMLQVSDRTLRRWVSERRIPCLRMGRLVRFDPGIVSRWLSARKE